MTVRHTIYGPRVEDPQGGVWFAYDRAAERLERLAARNPDAAAELALRLARKHSSLGGWRA